jgi:hypothetical protein
MPVSAPPVGLNTVLTEQEAPGANVEVQLVVAEKGPCTCGVETLNGITPEFVIVTVSAAEVEPESVLGKLS